MSAILKVNDLHKHYPGLKAVDGISFAIEQGICFGLLGPNGAGKTTTVEMLEGIITPTAGEILYRGRPVDSRFKDEAGIMFQHTSLQEYIQVREALELFARFYPKTRPLEQLIERCALGDFLDRDVRRLSGGQRQRLLLAIALINDPEIVFLDEPTTGLDPQARRNFWKLVQDIKAERKTLVLTTHYMEEAQVLCDEIAIMDYGHIIAQDDPQALLKKHFDDALVSLPAADLPADLAGDGHFNLQRKENRVEIATPDVEGVIRYLVERKVPLSHLQVRPRTLEDLFLELTGHELRA